MSREAFRLRSDRDRPGVLALALGFAKDILCSSALNRGPKLHRSWSLSTKQVMQDLGDFFEVGRLSLVTSEVACPAGSQLHRG